MNHSAALILPTKLRCICGSGHSFFNMTVFFTQPRSALQGPIPVALGDRLYLFCSAGHICYTICTCEQWLWAWLLPAPSVYHWWMLMPLELWGWQKGITVQWKIIVYLLYCGDHFAYSPGSHKEEESNCRSCQCSFRLMAKCLDCWPIGFQVWIEDWFSLWVRAKRGLDGRWMKRKLSANWWEQQDRDPLWMPSGGMQGTGYHYDTELMKLKCLRVPCFPPQGWL